METAAIQEVTNVNPQSQPSFPTSETPRSLLILLRLPNLYRLSVLKHRSLLLSTLRRPSLHHLVVLLHLFQSSSVTLPILQLVRARLSHVLTSSSSLTLLEEKEKKKKEESELKEKRKKEREEKKAQKE